MRGIAKILFCCVAAAPYVASGKSACSNTINVYSVSASENNAVPDGQLEGGFFGLSHKVRYTFFQAGITS